MDSLGIDNNTREIVWKITPKPKKTAKKAATAKTKSRPVQVNNNEAPEIKEMVSNQIQSLSSILFEKIQELEQEIKDLQTTQVTLENNAMTQKSLDTYTNDAVFQPWYL